MAIRLASELERAGMTWEELGRAVGASGASMERIKAGARPYPLRAVRIARAVGWRDDPMELFRKEGKAKGAEEMGKEAITLNDIHEQRRKATNEGIARAFMPLIEEMGLDPKKVLGEAAPEEEPDESRRRAAEELERLQAAKDEAFGAYESFDSAAVALDAQEHESCRRAALEELGRPRNAAEQRKFDMRTESMRRDALEAKREAKRLELRTAAVEAANAAAVAERAMQAVEHEEAVNSAADAMGREEREAAVKSRIVNTKDPAERRRLIAENMGLFGA